MARNFERGFLRKNVCVRERERILAWRNFWGFLSLFTKIVGIYSGREAMWEC